MMVWKATWREKITEPAEGRNTCIPLRISVLNDSVLWLSPRITFKELKPKDPKAATHYFHLLH